jgi:hypothetical protein
VNPVVICGCNGSPQFDLGQLVEDTLELLVVDVDGDLDRLKDMPASGLVGKFWINSCSDAVFSVGSIARFIVQLFEIVVQVGFPEIRYCWLPAKSVPTNSLGEGVEQFLKRYGI